MSQQLRSLGALLILITILPCNVFCRKHQLTLKDEHRRLIKFSTFGFLKGGFLEVRLNDIVIQPPVSQRSGSGEVVGFTVDRTLSDGINPYPHNIESSCAWKEDNLEDEGVSSILFSFDFVKNQVNARCSRTLNTNVKLYKESKNIPFLLGNTVTNKVSPDMGRLVITQRRKREADDKTLFQINSKGNEDQVKLSPVALASQQDVSNKSSTVGNVNIPAQQKQLEETHISQPLLNDKENENNVPPLNIDDPTLTNPKFPHSSEENSYDSSSNTCDGFSVPLVATTLSDGQVSYSTYFVVYIAGEDCEGLYSLYFHNCAGYEDSRVALNMSVVEENRNKNFLSAGEMPLPALYFMMSILFFVTSCFWVFILRKSKREPGVSVFKIHYLMGALVYLKSISLFFHSINYHYIQTEGTHIEVFAVLYYVAHLLKGALLFLTILLIGTGYAFVKHLLSDKDKKIFMVVIPLQILANVAEIIIEESEEGEIQHTTWKAIFIAVDLLCCGAILFPVVWSIKHLQEASQTDGKAASNLRKLKLFRHFYMIVVVYIYFTRIIINMLLRITVPFNYEWLDEMFREMTTFIFFVLTGYKFRPAVNNPYLEIANDSDDENEGVALTESGLTEGVVIRRGAKPRKKLLKEMVIMDPNEEDTDDDEEVLLEKRREASHDFD